MAGIDVAKIVVGTKPAIVVVATYEKVATGSLITKADVLLEVRVSKAVSLGWGKRMDLMLYCMGEKAF